MEDRVLAQLLVHSRRGVVGLLLRFGQGGRAHMDMNEEQPHVEDRCILWSDGMQLLKDAAERKHFLRTGLEGYSYLESLTRFLEVGCAKAS